MAPAGIKDINELRNVMTTIFNQHHGSVWKQIRRSGLSPEDTDELVQETFVSLADYIKAHNIPCSVRGMLRSLAQCKIRAHLREKVNTPMSVCLPSSTSEKPRSAPDLDRAIELRRLGRQALHVLSPEQHAAFTKVVIEGLTLREAAMALDIPEGTLKSRVISAKRAFVEYIQRFIPLGEADKQPC